MAALVEPAGGAFASGRACERQPGPGGGRGGAHKPVCGGRGLGATPRPLNPTGNAKSREDGANNKGVSLLGGPQGRRRAVPPPPSASRMHRRARSPPMHPSTPSRGPWDCNGKMGFSASSTSHCRITSGAAHAGPPSHGLARRAARALTRLQSTGTPFKSLVRRQEAHWRRRGQRVSETPSINAATAAGSASRPLS